MSLLSYNELVALRDAGAITCPLSAINGSSIDLTLQPLIRKELLGPSMDIVRLYSGESISTIEIDMSDGEHVMMPDSVVLGATVERFNLPLDISAEYSLKSTLARSFLAHQLAGWIDPGFEGTITLELKNDTQFHKLALAAGMKIGQVKFFKHEPVPVAQSYRTRGQYNGQDLVRTAGVLA